MQVEVRRASYGKERSCTKSASPAVRRAEEAAGLRERLGDKSSQAGWQSSRSRSPLA